MSWRVPVSLVRRVPPVPWQSFPPSAAGWVSGGWGTSVRWQSSAARAATLLSDAPVTGAVAAETATTSSAQKPPESPMPVPFGVRMKRLMQIARRDLQMISIFVDLRQSFWLFRRRQDTVASLLSRTVFLNPKKPALIMAPSGRSTSFLQLETFANKTANFLHDNRLLQKGEVAALFGGSSPEYVGLWLGVSKVGGISALVNSNLLAESLINSLTVANPQLILVDLQLKAQFHAVRHAFPDVPVMYYSSRREDNAAGTGLRLLNDAVESCDSNIWDLEQSARKSDSRKWFPWRRRYSDADSSLNETLFYIFTSGTTGPPKSCIITQRRFMGFAKIVQLVNGLKYSDVIYCPLPIYHTAGGIATVGQALMHGSTVVLRNKFSASAFWEDVQRYNCTAAQYIGEMCRFLLAQRPRDVERQHQLRVLYGQGLRPAVWRHFLDRFAIPRVVEMYGSTEGNTGLANMHGVPGAVGYLSPVLHTLHPQALIQVDRETGEVIRNGAGFCVKVSADGEGELLGEVSWDPLKKFDGYTSKKATEGKLLRDVFKKGDLYFRSGDIMRLDKDGFVYFVDRLGDAYRWKGENVSSTEVEGILSMLCGHGHVAVYGVHVPGAEGQAGMASIAFDTLNVRPEKMDEKVMDLPQEMLKHLPPYAVPLFLRVTPTDAIQLTGTFRVQKNTLKRESFDPALIGTDRLYYLEISQTNSKTSPKSMRYLPLTPDVYSSIQQGRVRF